MLTILQTPFSVASEGYSDLVTGENGDFSLSGAWDAPGDASLAEEFLGLEEAGILPDSEPSGQPSGQEGDGAGAAMDAGAPGDGMKDAVRSAQESMDAAGEDLMESDFAADPDDNGLDVNGEETVLADAYDGAPEAGGIITGFTPLQTDVYAFEGDPAEEELACYLPQTLQVCLQGGRKQQMPVHWEVVEDYDHSDFYFYSLRPVWSGAYVLSQDLNASTDVPWITVFRQMSEKEEQAGVQEPEMPVADPEDIAMIYTEEEGSIDPESGTPSITSLLRIFTEESYAASSNADKVYTYLTKTLKLNRAAACAVMTNMYAESGLLSNNLENTYNILFGLTDTEYTKRVNAGIKSNGKYQTRGGSTRYFTKDYCGYGLCQWTSLTRRANLLKKAVKKNASISDIDMQLEFLADELENSYGSVWATLQNVPDTAEGAFLAAAEFCAAFEVPANTYNTAISRAKTCLATYWKQYGGKTTSGASYLGLCGYSWPKAVGKGVGLTVSGYTISNYKITSITAKIKNSAGEAVYSKTVKPSAYIYSLYNLDSAMKFSKLSAGTYTYTLSAKNADGDMATASHQFKVTKGGSTQVVKGCSAASVKTTLTTAQAKAATSVTAQTKAAASTLKVTGAKYPKSLKRGKSFVIKGTVKSNYNLKKVTVGVYTTAGKGKITASKTLSGKKSYQVAGLDEKITFGKLPKGTYYYIIKATDTKKSKTLLKKKFKVK